MEEKISMPICPMAATCKGIMEKRSSRIWTMVPGLLFIVFGVAIIIYPKILLWLVAIILIAMGLGMLVMAGFMRSFGQHIEHGSA